MHGEVPGWIKKGRTVLYKRRRVVVTDYYFTCPCAIGEEWHPEGDDLLMLKLKGIIGRVPAFKVERDPGNKPPHKVKKSLDPWPPFKKGATVFHVDRTNLNDWKARVKRAVVKNCYVTCPCVNGDVFHNPGEAVRIIELEGIGEVRSEDVISYKEYLERRRGERRMNAVFAAAAERVAADFYIPTGYLYPPKRKRSKKKGRRIKFKEHKSEAIEEARRRAVAEFSIPLRDISTSFPKRKRSKRRKR